MGKSSETILTVRKIETAKVPRGKSFVMLWDARVPGLGVRKSDKSVMWKMRLLQNGKRVTETIGVMPGMSLEETRRVVEEAKARRAVGEPVTKKERPPEEERTSDSDHQPMLVWEKVDIDELRELVKNEEEEQREREEQWKKDLKEAQRAGRKDLPKKPEVPEPVVVSCNDAFYQYLKIHGLQKLRRPADVERMWRQDLAPILGDRDIGSLTGADVVRACDRIETRKAHSPSVIAHNKRLLRAFLNWAGKRGYATKHIADDMNVVKVRRRTHTPTLDEVRKVVAAARDMGIRPHGVVRLCWLTGSRVREVAGMRWDELRQEEDGPAWIVPEHRMKAKEEHWVPLSGRAWQIIEDQRELSVGSAFVFPSLNKGPEHPYDPGNLPGQLRRRSGVTNFKVHDVRSTVTQYLLRQGVRTEVIKLVLGHTQNSAFGGGATMNYIGDEVLREEQRKAVELLAAAGVVD